MLLSPNLSFLFLIAFFCLFPSLTEAKLDHKQPRRPSYYWSNRHLECVNHGLNISRCSLKKEGRVSELNPGCFDEIDASNQTRVYCRLNCEEADETTVLRKEPSNNHICSAYHTYNLERRRVDWYIWRIGGCISTTIKFALRCGFPSDPRVFYAKHKHLFEYEEFNANATTTNKRQRRKR
ncbi:hypothetical protein niasHS_007284 [Heterodera schachtii]|uniref:DUF7808 domain-containing protein n=1 Tax=Heterodera schachtii TaxID=97005 RepID=A0ABD2JK78_HETSC